MHFSSFLFFPKVLFSFSFSFFPFFPYFCCWKWCLTNAANTMGGGVNHCKCSEKQALFSFSSTRKLLSVTCPSPLLEFMPQLWWNSGILKIHALTGKTSAHLSYEVEEANSNILSRWLSLLVFSFLWYSNSKHNNFTMPFHPGMLSSWPWVRSLQHNSVSMALTW